MYTKITMGEKTSLTLNTPYKASLRTTIPMFIVKQWNLQRGHQLDWTLEVCKDNELVAVVRKAITDKRKSRK
jgi:hypothetical protein